MDRYVLPQVPSRAQLTLWGGCPLLACVTWASVYHLLHCTPALVSFGQITQDICVFPCGVGHCCFSSLFENEVIMIKSGASMKAAAL